MEKKEKWRTPFWVLGMMGLFLMPSVLFSEVAVMGKIEEINSRNQEQYELTIKNEKGKTNFLLNASTAIQALIPADKVKIGHKLLVNVPVRPEAARAKQKDTRNQGKALGGANRPLIPQLPPKLPPRLPPAGFPTHTPPSAAGAKQVMPRQQGKEAMAQGGAAGNETGMPPGPAEKTKTKKADKDLPPPPPDATATFMTKTTISKSAGEAQGPAAGIPAQKNSMPAQKVIGLNASPEGVRLELEDENGKKSRMLLQPGQKVSQLLGVEDLHKDMAVELDVMGDSEPRVVQRVKVL